MIPAVKQHEQKQNRKAYVIAVSRPTPQKLTKIQKINAIESFSAAC